MADNVTNELLLEHLKRVQTKISGLESGINDVMAELRSHKAMLGALVTSEAVQDGRIADVSERRDRIEKRLDLRGAE